MLSRWRSEIPHVGEYIPADENIIANQDKKTIKLKVANTGDRPIQVGSHTHFSEANRALEFDRDGSTRKWNNPNTGNSGSVTPKRTFQTASGENCREYEHTIMVDGKSEIAKGTACRKPDGTWHVIN